MSHKRKASEKCNESPGDDHQNGCNKMIIPSIYEDVQKWDVSDVLVGCKMVPPLWNTDCQFLKKLNLKWSYNPARMSSLDRKTSLCPQRGLGKFSGSQIRASSGNQPHSSATAPDLAATWQQIYLIARMFPSWGISGAEMQAPTPLGLGQILSALVSRSRLICHAYQLA